MRSFQHLALPMAPFRKPQRTMLIFSYLSRGPNRYPSSSKDLKALDDLSNTYVLILFSYAGWTGG